MISRIFMVVGAFLLAGYFGTQLVAKKITTSTDANGRFVAQSRAWLADAITARQQYKVLVYGNGSVVIPGRRVLLHSDKSPAGIADTVFKFRAYDSEPEWLRPHRKALVGLREGSQISLGPELPNITIDTVCDEILFGLKCKPPIKETVSHPELLACEKTTSADCSTAIESSIRRAGTESAFEFAEICLLEKETICSGLFITLISKWEKNIETQDRGSLKEALIAIVSVATKKTQDGMIERMLRAPPPIAEVALKDLLSPLDAEKMRALLKAVQGNVPAASLITSRIVARIHDGSGAKLIEDSGLKPVAAILQAAELRNSLANRRAQIEASIRAGKMSEFEKTIFKSSEPLVPGLAKPLDLVKLSVDGYTPYMLAVIAGRNFSGAENSAVSPNDPNLLKANTRGETVLHFLAERGQLADLQAFLQRNDKANIEARDTSGKKPIDWARERNFEPIVNYLENLKK